MKIKVTDKGRGEGGFCSVSFPMIWDSLLLEGH